jgi:hypothetical protein
VTPLLAVVLASFVPLAGTMDTHREGTNSRSVNSIYADTIIHADIIHTDTTHADHTRVEWYSDQDSVLVITTARQLKEFSQLVNSGTTTFKGKIIKLGNNIQLNDTTGWQRWDSVAVTRETWVPVGTRKTPFKGTFDGQGHVVSGLYIHTGTEGFYQGLFGVVEGATIRNLGIEASYIKAYENVGAVAGYICRWSLISGCYNTGVVTGERNTVGGIVGYSEGTNTIINCYNAGRVTGKRCTGGITGSFQNGSLYNCCNNGAVTGQYEDIGGIAGNIVDPSYVTIRYADIKAMQDKKHVDTLANCYNTGMVRGRDVIGGIVGHINLNEEARKAKRAFFANCYNAGRLISRFPVVTDGLIGVYSLTGAQGFYNHFDMIRRYGDVCYWATEVCTIPVLMTPRFDRYLRSDLWRETMLNQQESSRLFKSVPGRYMQSAEFVTALNNWVDKKPGPYKRWILDTLGVNGGYPVFEGGHPAKL